MGTTDYKAVEKLIESASDRDYVEHYGIPGMKWGVRRSQSTLDRIAGRAGATTKNVKANVSNRRQARREERDAVRTIKREGRVSAAKAKAEGEVKIEKAKADKKVSEIATGSDQKTSTSAPAKNLTDKELKARVDRLNLEKQYKTLTTKPKNKTTKDRVQDFAIKQGTKFVTQAADAMIQKSIGNITGSSSQKKGADALSSKISKTISSPQPKLNVSKNVTSKAVANTKSKVADSLVRSNESTKLSDIVDAYTYVGKRRLNKDRKVTNRRNR